MTEPTPTPAPYRVVLGLRVPLDFVPRVVAALRASYPEATAGITDHDRAVRAAMRAWIIETVADHEKRVAVTPRDIAVARLVAEYDTKAAEAREKAIKGASAIVEDTPPPPPPEEPTVE